MGSFFTCSIASILLSVPTSQRRQAPPHTTPCLPIPTSHKCTSPHSQTCGRGQNQLNLECTSVGGFENACCPVKPGPEVRTCNAQPCGKTADTYDVIYVAASSADGSNATNLCVTADSSNTVALQACSGDTDQLWTQIDSAVPNQKQWVNFLTGRCLRVPASFSDAEQDQITLGDCTVGDKRQDFVQDHLVSSTVCCLLMGRGRLF